MARARPSGKGVNGEPLVGIVGGSKTDLPYLEKTVEVLKHLGVRCELRVVRRIEPRIVSSATLSRPLTGAFRSSWLGRVARRICPACSPPRPTSR